MISSWFSLCGGVSGGLETPLFLCLKNFLKKIKKSVDFLKKLIIIGSIKIEQLNQKNKRKENETVKQHTDSIDKRGNL